MRRPAVLLAAALLCSGLAACREPGARSRTQNTSNASGSGKPSAQLGRDRDGDEDKNDDDEHVLSFGRVPPVIESQAIATLIYDYFADAAAEDGAKACSLLTPFIAESVVEEDGQAPPLQGSTCALVMSKLFKLHHDELAGKSTDLKLLRAGVEGDRSLVVLEFPEIPEIRQITLRHAAGKWTVLDLLDGKIE